MCRGRANLDKVLRLGTLAGAGRQLASDCPGALGRVFRRDECLPGRENFRCQEHGEAWLTRAEGRALTLEQGIVDWKHPVETGDDLLYCCFCRSHRGLESAVLSGRGR